MKRNKRRLGKARTRNRDTPGMGKSGGALEGGQRVVGRRQGGDRGEEGTECGGKPRQKMADAT